MVQRPDDGGALEVRPSIPLIGDVDVRAIARAVPEHHRVRGMFFTRCRNELPDGEFAELLPALREPPALGRYLPFADYSTHDYVYLFASAALHAHPRVCGAEAWRLYAREEILAYEKTMLGRVTLSLITDPATALLRFPEIVAAMAIGPRTVTTQLSERSVRIEVFEPTGAIEHALGMFEGVVMFFKRHPRIEVESREGTTWRFIVHWTM